MTLEDSNGWVLMYKCRRENCKVVNRKRKIIRLRTQADMKHFIKYHNGDDGL